MLTDRILIELLEYVLRNAAFPPGPSALGIELCPLVGRVGRPREDPDDIVSSESVPGSVPCSEDVVGGIAGTGGTSSAGARNPFFVVEDRFGEKRSLALGAEATRRINRGSAPIDLGDLGPPCRFPDGGERGLKDVWEG